MGITGLSLLRGTRKMRAAAAPFPEPFIPLISLEWLVKASLYLDRGTVCGFWSCWCLSLISGLSSEINGARRVSLVCVSPLTCFVCARFRAHPLARVISVSVRLGKASARPFHDGRLPSTIEE